MDDSHAQGANDRGAANEDYTAWLAMEEISLLFTFVSGCFWFNGFKVFFMFFICLVVFHGCLGVFSFFLRWC